MFAAIPFFQLGVYYLKIPGLNTELPIDPWATLVCIGIVVGLEVARHRAVKLGLDVRDIVDGAVFIVCMGFVMAHVVTVVFYKPERLAEEGIWAILKVWEGFASSGGFIGAILGAWLFYGFIRKRPALRHADIICFGFPFGWFFGRMGCGVVHDHIGAVTTFPLGMQFPPWHSAAGLRHELGLYEMVYMIPVCLLFLYWGQRDRVPGFFLGWFAVLYAPARFVLDFLRNADLEHQDLRYIGLTPAQYGMVALFLAGAWLLWSRDHAGYVPVEMGAAAREPEALPEPEVEAESEAPTG